MTRHNAWRSLLLPTLLLLLLSIMWPMAVSAQEGLELEEEAKALEKKLICPVCPGESLNQSQATLAKQMRAIVRERLAEGESPQEIIDYFVSVYGELVLAEPPKRGFSLAIWLVPPGALAAGAALVVWAVRTLRRPVVEAPGAGAASADNPDMANPDMANPEMEGYLRLVDRELQGTADEDGQEKNNG